MLHNARISGLCNITWLNTINWLEANVILKKSLIVIIQTSHVLIFMGSDFNNMADESIFCVPANAATGMLLSAKQLILAMMLSYSNNSKT